MQTFLPYQEFDKSAQCLDYRRLGKQRVEARQIINALTGVSAGWVNHPATIMWRDHVPALELYHDEMILEWESRGYRNNMPLCQPDPETIRMPLWLGDPRFHMSHQSNLLRKDPIFYGKFGWTVPDNLPYIWPS